jgi:hypothetical protein
VVFTQTLQQQYPNSVKNCDINVNTRILGIGVDKSYSGTLNLLNDTVTVLLAADFSGGN